MGDRGWGPAIWLVLFFIFIVLGFIAKDVKRIREALTAGPVVEQEVDK